MNVISAKQTNQDMDYPFRFRYETLRSILNKNGEALKIMSDLEADLNHMPHYDEKIKHPIYRLITEAILMSQELNLLTKDRHSDLYETLFDLHTKTEMLFKDAVSDTTAPMAMMLDTTKVSETKLIGGKAAGVCALIHRFTDLVPPAFVITTAAYKKILHQNNLDHRIRLLLNNLDVTTDQDQFRSRTQTIRRWIREAAVDNEIESAITSYAKQIAESIHNTGWAVRSSAVYEDGIYSFAGQFDTELWVDGDHLLKAYKNVLASRFSDRAVTYRMHTGIREFDTPMAVLFMPMVDPVAAGVVYTTDLENPDSNHIIINAVPGLADRMVKGEVQADTFLITKSPELKLNETVPAVQSSDTQNYGTYITSEDLLYIADTALKASAFFGHELDLEWALDHNGKIALLQARRLNVDTHSNETVVRRFGKKKALPILESGITIFPGRAEGPIFFLGSRTDADVPEGSIVVVDKPRPELARILPKIAALLAIEGNPVGHLATLVREFGVPCIFRAGQNAKLLYNKDVVSVNASKRAVYDGVRWPGIRDRVLARIALKDRQKKSGPLFDLILKLNLLDPDASSFKAKSCRSVHDTLRFVHEMSVRSMFGFGDSHNRPWNKKSRQLKTGLPIKLRLIDLANTVPPNMKKIAPQEVKSIPFQALWRGFSDTRLAWPERWEKEMRGMPSDFQEAVLGGTRGPRRATDTNYAIVAKDYINVNARFAYHYAMIDAMVGEGNENNHVHFRFRGGGASDEKRNRRAHFLETVLRENGFGVERQQDLVTAWLRRYPRNDSEAVLEVLGRLLVCARQLDVILFHDNDIKRYAAHFLNGEYSVFV